METLRFVRLSADARISSRGSLAAAGFDLHSIEGGRISPGGRLCVHTGLQVAIPSGFYGRIAPRSGLSLRHGIDVGAGVVDGDYRGELCVILFNFGDSVFEFASGDRIAQLVVEKIFVGEAVEVSSLDETVRGVSGFGASGI